MTTTPKAATKMEVRWPTAAVLIALLVCVTLVYVLVPDHRTEILAALAVAGPVLLGFMRRVLAPVAVLCLAIAIPVGASGCGNPTVLSALELARKVGCATLCPAAEP